MVKQLPKSVKALTNQTAVLECQVDSAGITSYWMKDGKRLDDDEMRLSPKYEMTAEAMTHTLKLNEITSTDSGLYTFVAGSTQSHTTIYVEGATLFFFSCILPRNFFLRI